MAGIFLIVAIAFFGGLNSQKINSTKKYKKIYLFSVFGAMILFAVLRGFNVGIDYEFRSWEMELIMKRDFQMMMTYGTQEREWLYYILIWLISRVIPSAWAINSLMDCFVLATFGWFFYRYAKDITIPTVMFVAFAFAAELNISRQYFAAALFLIALHLLIQKHPWKALIPLIAGALIHASAILLFVVYIAYFVGLKITRRRLVIYLAAAVAIFVFFEPILDLFLTLFPRYSFALKDKYVGNSGFSIKWLCVYLAIFAGDFLISPGSDTKILSGGSVKSAIQKLRSANSEIGEDTKLHALIALSFVLYALMSMLRCKMWFVQRFQVYFLYGFLMIIPEILQKLPLKPKVRNAVEIAAKAAISVWGYVQFAKDPHGLLPYTFIWQ